MSRQDDFIEAGIQYRFEHGKPMAIGGGNFDEVAREMNRNKVYEDGCEHGYQYAIEKACEWLENELHKGLWGKSQSAFIEQFKYAMEE